MNYHKTLKELSGLEALSKGERRRRAKKRQADRRRRLTKAKEKERLKKMKQRKIDRHAKSYVGQKVSRLRFDPKTGELE